MSSSPFFSPWYIFHEAGASSLYLTIAKSTGFQVNFSPEAAAFCPDIGNPKWDATRPAAARVLATRNFRPIAVNISQLLLVIKFLGICVEALLLKFTLSNEIFSLRCRGRISGWTSAFCVNRFYDALGFDLGDAAGDCQRAGIYNSCFH